AAADPSVACVGTAGGGVWRTMDINRTDTVPYRLDDSTLTEAAPDTAAAGTTAAPPAPAVAGTLPAGTYTYRITFVNANLGTQSQASAVVTGTLAAAGTLRLSKLPLGPAGTTGRRIYRAGPGNSDFKIVATTADNV